MRQPILGLGRLEQDMERPQKTRIRQQIGENDHILALREAQRTARLTSWLLRVRHDRHLIVDR